MFVLSKLCPVAYAFLGAKIHKEQQGGTVEQGIAQKDKEKKPVGGFQSQLVQGHAVAVEDDARHRTA